MKIEEGLAYDELVKLLFNEISFKKKKMEMKQEMKTILM